MKVINLLKTYLSEWRRLRAKPVPTGGKDTRSETNGWGRKKNSKDKPRDGGLTRRDVNPQWKKTQENVLRVANQLIEEQDSFTDKQIGNILQNSFTMLTTYSGDLCYPTVCRMTVGRIMKANKYRFYRAR